MKLVGTVDHVGSVFGPAYDQPYRMAWVGVNNWPERFDNESIRGLKVYIGDNTSLSFDSLRGANLARIPQFKNCHGELAHSRSDGSDWSPAQWLQAVTGELGEYANKRKKFERGDLTEEEFKSEASKELADVVTYLDILAHQLGIDLGKAVIDKFNLVSERVSSDVRLSAEGWGRVETAT